jgi:soluble lytic murein transglycosylase-like protein
MMHLHNGLIAMALVLGRPDAHEPGERFGVRDAFNPGDNIRGGMSYLRWLLKHFKGDVTKAVAAYNAGERAVRKYGSIPPYRETRNYVRKIRRLYTRLRHAI